MSVLVDTGVFAAILDENAVGFRLSAAQRDVLTGNRLFFVSPISFYEIGQKVRHGKWPEMAPHAAKLTDIARQANIGVRSLNGPILNEAALLDWDHRDPFDRIIVSTARHFDMDLVTTDTALADFYGRTIS